MSAFQVVASRPNVPFGAELCIADSIMSVSENLFPPSTVATSRREARPVPTPRRLYLLSAHNESGSAGHAKFPLVRPEALKSKGS